jgi:regulatory protein
MEENIQEQEIFQKMAHFCSKSEQCTPDILKRLKDAGCTGQQAEEIIQHLKVENYLNDQRYVSLYIREKFRVNKWGRVKMHYYLKMKGLKDDLIQSGFSEIDEEEYTALLLKTMKEKARTIKISGKYEKMGQIIRFTQGRGFEPELIHRYLNQVVS